MSAHDERMRKVADKFRRDMEKLGLGVTITLPGQKPVIVTHDPRCKQDESCQCAGKDSQDEQ